MKPVQRVAEIERIDEPASIDFGAQIAECREVADRQSALLRLRDACDSLFERIDPFEATVVGFLLARSPTAIKMARAFDEAGKGLLYPVLAAAALVVDGPDMFMVILACAIATALSLAIYPMLKQAVRRERPLAFDPELGVGVEPIDRFSWPSGHSITAIAFLVPFAVAGSSLLPLIAPLTLLVLWSRVALGHHYPSDVAGGAAIGATIAGACCLVVGI